MAIISGGAGGGGGIKLFDSGALAAPAASIDTGANGIAGGHVDLSIYIYVRSDRVAQQDNINIRVNNDSGGNYDTQRLQGLNVTATSITANAATALTGQAATIPAASDTAGQFASIQIWIPSYDNTAGFKLASVINSYADETAAQNGAAVFSSSWRNTAAITRLAITPVAGTNFVVGSRMAVYGTQ